MLSSLEHSFVTHVKQCVADFYNNVIADEFKLFSYLCGFEDSDFKSRKAIKLLTKRLDRQLVFIQYCATCKLLSNNSKTNIEKIIKWVKLQGLLISRKTKPLYGIFLFLSDESKVFLFANDLNDIDFSDIYSATFFEGFSISNASWSYLTKAKLDATLRKIQKDMAFDQYKILFGIPQEYAPSRKNALIVAQCQVAGIPSIDKIAKIKKANELFNIDVLKMFKP
jgi:hypothetical protein